jgi:hypothetical protein
MVRWLLVIRTHHSRVAVRSSAMLPLFASSKAMHKFQNILQSFNNMRDVGHLIVKGEHYLYSLAQVTV